MTGDESGRGGANGSPCPAAAQALPRVIPHGEAHAAADPLTRLKAHALSVVLAVVPVTWALFYGVTRRLEIDDGVFVQRQTPPAPSTSRWRDYVAGAHLDDPLAPRRVAGTNAAVLTLADAATGEESPHEAHDGYLATLGAADVAALYLRSAGGIVGTIALVRGRDEPVFEPHEVRLLRRLHPLLEHAYVYAREPEVDTERPDPLAGAGLTPREAEVAQLVGTGATNAEIARALHMSLATVKTHLTQIYLKLGLRSRTQLAILLRPSSALDDRRG